MKKESLSSAMPKLIMAVTLIVGIGAVLGAAGYIARNKPLINPEPEVLVAPLAKESVSVATDKMEYKQGETIKITIQNNLNQSIGYWDYSGQTIPFIGIQKFQDEKWENIEGQNSCACKNNCTTYANGWVELKSKEIINDSWNTKTDCTGIIVSEGKYRVWFSYNMDLTVQGGKFTDVYSKEFDIIKNAEDETVDWKTYKNDQYGFEVKYPSDWQVDDNAKIGSPDAEGISFQKPLRWGFNFYSFGKVNDNDYKSLSILENSGYDMDKVYINISGINANIYVVKNFSDVDVGYPIDVTLRKNDNVYNINGFLYNDADREEFVKLFREILSTFKFIETTKEKNSIIYPDRQTIWQTGETHLVQWTPKDSDGTVDIRLNDNTAIDNATRLVFQPSISPKDIGNYSFTISKGLQSNNRYQFLITQYPSGESLMSEEFTIVGE